MLSPSHELNNILAKSNTETDKEKPEIKSSKHRSVDAVSKSSNRRDSSAAHSKKKSSAKSRLDVLGFGSSSSALSKKPEKKRMPTVSIPTSTQASKISQLTGASSRVTAPRRRKKKDAVAKTKISDEGGDFDFSFW